MQPNTTRNILLTVLGILGLGAVYGGVILIISPTGEMLGLPVTEFKNLPFSSFMIPGIILLTVLGIIPFLVILGLVKKPDSKLADMLNVFKDMHWSWTFSIYVAFTLVGWVHIQLIFLGGGVHWLHTFYIFYALLIILIALLPQVRSSYQDKK